MTEYGEYCNMYISNLRGEYMITILLICIVLIATYMDIRWYTIKNSFICFSLILGIICRILFMHQVSFIDGVLGFIVPFFCLIPIYIIHGIGAGDIKLFMVIGVYLGLHSILLILFYSFIFGGILSFIILLLSRKLMIKITYFCSYLKQIFTMLRAGEGASIKPYYNIQQYDKKEVIHFCIPILLAVLYITYKNYI